MISDYIIQGGRKLEGEVKVNSSKNSAAAVLIAALLNDKKTIIFNLPKIEEIKRVIEILQSIGVRTRWQGRKLELLPPKKIDIKKINKKAAEKTRIMVLLIGALVHKLNSFDLPFPGGCRLGRRSLAPHIYALENFGIKIKELGCKIRITADKLKRAEIVMYESSDTATENAILAASLIPGKTSLRFASSNYQVQDLCFFLQKLGVKIEGIGTTTLTVYGKKRLKRIVKYHLSEDPIETMLFLAAAIVTKSSIVIKRCPIEFLELELLKLQKMGFLFKILKRYKAENGKTSLVDIKTFPSNLIAPVEKLYGRPFPGLNIDNLPFFVPIATQAKGETLIHDWVYENRAIYYTDLTKLGAKIKLADPHRVYISGPTKLKAGEIVCPPALRPSAIILIAMLAARGKSVLRNTYAIERGYENIVERLQKLGADIKRAS